ncbi:hypothetical protein CL635_02060 [bacterium]|nr:hypothetical protein [bacterium]
MLSSVLVAYFIHQFSLPVNLPHRPDQSPRHIQSVHPRGHLTIDAQAAATASVPPDARRVEMLRLRMEADCSGDASITTISVQRRGLGANSDIESLYVVHRGQRISRARSVARRDGSVDLNVRDFRIPACEEEDVLVIADFSPDAAPAGEHRLELRSVDAGGTTVRIDYRVGDFTRTRKTAGRALGQISVNYLNLTRRVRYGNRQIVSRFTVQADSRDNHLLRAVTFTNNGSASNADMQDLYIDFRNRRISSLVPQMNGDTVRLEFDPPFFLKKNHKLKFALRADVRASRSRTIQFVVEEAADLEATPVVGR